MTSLLNLSSDIIRDVLVEWLCPQDWTKVDTATSGTLRNDFLHVLSSISNAESGYQSYEWLCLRGIAVKAVSIKVSRNIPEALKTFVSKHAQMLSKVNVLEFDYCEDSIQTFMRSILGHCTQLSEFAVTSGWATWKISPTLMVPCHKQTLKKVDLTGCECDISQYLTYLSECSRIEQVCLNLGMPLNPLAMMFGPSPLNPSLLARVCSKETMTELYIINFKISFWYKNKLTTSTPRRPWLQLACIHSSSILQVIEKLNIVELELCKFCMTDSSLPMASPRYFKTVTSLHLYHNWDDPEVQPYILFLTNVAVNVTTLELNEFEEEGLRSLLTPVLTRLKEIKLEDSSVSKEFVKSIIVGGAANLEKITFQCASISQKRGKSVMNEAVAKKELQKYAKSVASSVEIVFTHDRDY